MSRQALVEVTITVPQGDSMDDWGFVTHFFTEVEEDLVRASEDTRALSKRIYDEVLMWFAQNPGKEMTEEKKKTLVRNSAMRFKSRA